jgi:NADPH-dependent 7-cyano-7-deazaguanine reductase QueF
MIVIHSFRLVCRCPVNDTVDAYECVVSFDRFVRCEDLLLIAEKYNGKIVFQEHLTQSLANDLLGTVGTKGMHVNGKVTTSCICSPEK